MLLVADAVLGSMLARSQGRATWRRFNEAIQAGRPPAREVLDGALVLFGGALLLTPGFLSDMLAADPAPAAVARGGPAAPRAPVPAPHGRLHARPGRAARRARRPAAQPYDIEGTAVERDGGAERERP